MHGPMTRYGITAIILIFFPLLVSMSSGVPSQSGGRHRRTGLPWFAKVWRVCPFGGAVAFCSCGFAYWCFWAGRVKRRSDGARREQLALFIMDHAMELTYVLRGAQGLAFDKGGQEGEGREGSMEF